MANVGADIKSTDLNTLRNTIIEVLGSGLGSYGYGQNIESSAVLSGQVAAKSDFDAIRFDLVSSYIHQTGELPSLTLAQTNIAISAGAGDPINQYAFIANTVRNNRFDVAAGLLSPTAIGPITPYTSSWNTSAQATITLNFTSADEARYFFNAGSKIRINTSRIGGTGSQQNNAWTNLLDAADDQVFGAGTNPLINYYTLTNAYQTYYSLASSTPYSDNRYELQARVNVADNSTGTATQLEIRVLLSDDYVDLGDPAPGDLVDGTLTITAEELKTAGGTLQPSGDPFTVTSPTYSVSSITAT